MIYSTFITSSTLSPTSSASRYMTKVYTSWYCGIT